jgi:hypothetical protein
MRGVPDFIGCGGLQRSEHAFLPFHLELSGAGTGIARA